MRKARAIRRAEVPDYTIANAPGPDASADEQREHYKAVQGFLATHAYDVFVYLCAWCLKDEQAYPRQGEPRGDRLFCSERCQAASAKMQGMGGPPPQRWAAPTVQAAPRKKRGRHPKDCMCERHSGTS